MKNKSYFKFLFDLQSKNKVILSYFYLSENNPSNKLEELTSDDEGSFADMIIDSEDRYGVHNCDFSSHEFCGFSSTDVEEENIVELMENIMNYFKKEKYECSELFLITQDYKSNDYEHFNNAHKLIKEKYLDKIK